MPWLWDPNGRSWSSVAHWPLYLRVGTDRRRTLEKITKRRQTPSAQMGRALYQFKNYEITSEEYVTIVAAQMEVKNGPKRNGDSWQDYAWDMLGKATGKAKGRGKAERKGKVKGKSINTRRR